MSENGNNVLPDITAGRSVGDIQAKELEKYWLDPTKDYPEPHYLLEYNGVGFSPLGGIQALSGQKKNGKSFVLTQLMAAVLGTGTERVESYLPGLRLRDKTREYLAHPPSVLYVDTEMERLNTAKVLRRVHWLCGFDMKRQYECFNVLWLREVPKGEKESANHERWRLIQIAIEQKHPDIVFIDGMRDLMDDFNDLKESSTIIGEMMALASQRNICIWNVLHMNPRPSNDDESKMRGHAGTELGNKVSDTFISTKKKDATIGRVTFTVKQQDARGKDVDDWQFEIVDDAGGLGIPRIIGAAAPKTQKSGDVIGDDPQSIKSWIDASRDRYDWPMSKGDIKKKVFGELGRQMNHEKQNADLTIAINSGFLEQSLIKKNGSYMLQPREEMPF